MSTDHNRPRDLQPSRAGLLAPEQLVLSLALGVGGCYVGVNGAGSTADDAGESSDADSGNAGSSGSHAEPDDIPMLATHSGLRRLTAYEYDNVLRDILGDDSRPGAEFLPVDALTPFDNDYEGQSPGEALVLGAERLASEAAARLVQDSARLTSVVGCTPEALGASQCLRDFVERFGRRAFRRPLDPEEVEQLTGLAIAGEWDRSVAAVVRAILQDPNLLYRVEIGEPVDGAPGIRKLNDWEIATRMSFLLWGTTPDEAMLDAASAGEFSTASQIRQRATAMLTDDRAQQTITRFHAMWLGYSRLGGDGLPDDMLDETRASIERVVFEDDEPWLSLLTRGETYVTSRLAAHYDLPDPGGMGAGWVEYGDSGRGGILSHGTVLSLGAKFGDTSPTVRGAQLRERMFCQTLTVPADLEVNTDDPPGVDPDDCKWDRYADHREVGVCAGCHALTDGLGFGLENYSPTGAFRTHDVDKPQCEISGDGEVVGVGEFNGPAELGELLAQTPAVQECAIQQVYRFATGRSQPDALDLEYLNNVIEQHADGQLRLGALLVELVASEAFRFRAIEEGT